MKFKPAFLYRKDNELKELLASYEARRELLNIALHESKTILDRELEANEIEKLCATPGLFLTELKLEIKSKYPYPKGTDEANHSLLGISYTEIEATVSRLADSELNYKVADGSLLADPQQIKQIEKSCDVYTQNERQNEIFEAVTNLANTINEFIKLEQGVPVHFCRNISSGLLQPEYVDGKINAVVDAKKIEYI